MVRHLMKLLWRRRRASAFLVAELLLTYLVLFGIVTMSLDAVGRYNMPRGFSTGNVLNIAAGEPGQRSDTEVRAPVFLRLGREVAALPGIERVGFAQWNLYAMTMSIGTFDVGDGRRVRMNETRLSDECRDLLDLQVVQGRWFGPEDDALQDVPVVINQRLARELYGDQDPIGKVFRNNRRVIGVVTDYRIYGDFDEPRNMIIGRLVLDSEHPSYAETVLVRTDRPPDAALRARILETLQAVEPSWTYTVTPIEDLRLALLKQRLTPYLMAGVAGGSLMFMVVLGLFGVLWLTITRRTREIGLRRSSGATVGAIHRQIVGEMLILASAGILPGVALLLQFMAVDLPFLSPIPAATHLLAMAVSAALLLGIVALCSLYPGRLATLATPAEALRYE